MATNPYQAIGLRHNPFIGTEQLAQTVTFWLDHGYSEAPLPGGNQFVQILGEKGFGKTAHLHHWRSQTGGSYCYVPPNYLQRWQWLKTGAIAYWDEVDRLPLGLFLGGLLRVRMRRGTVVVGSHVDVSFWAKLAGLKTTTIQLPSLDIPTLQAWAAFKIAAATIPDQTCPLILSPEKAAEIVTQSQGSWRRAADYLHIWVAAIAFSNSQQN
ncbi:MULTISPECIES: hypothetical protein [Cyanophyceae]|uniref:hypothetical protein n=1 Tax=Cyanophyceae TaxID=3028117 RepID=UPI00016DCBDF|nr:MULTISPECIES: hypothetical protein [Cyanophyceae]ACA99715.1 hypothetical protein SYNPCC7002_A1726 [Picosynechococcus sp. PCC 7002]SMH56620.1 hypothetical protein SAMN06272755_3068 [Picosynechococcus sp. OG1]SMQ83457.1 hypothetical protein SAMN06272774_2344 [Synechococcus sp. 7002]